MIKVLHIIPSLAVGGAEKLVSDMVEFADRSRFDVAVMRITGTDSFLVEKLTSKGYQVYTIVLDYEAIAPSKVIRRLLRAIKNMRRTYNLLREIRPDIIHSHLSALRIALIPALLCRIPVKVHTIHTVAEKDAKGITRFFNRIAFKFFGFVPVSISQEVAESVKKLYGRKISTPVIYNGIDVQKFSIDQPKRVDRDKTILINVARLSREKNHALLVRAFSKAVQSCPNLELWLVGDGELRRDIEELVKQLGLEEKVKFFGVRSDVPELLSQADIFVLSSDYEGSGLVVAEAMAAGLPVIATAIGGIPEILEGGRAGILVPPKDVDALAKAIVELARDEKKRAELSDYGRKLVAERFDIRRTVREYEKLYLELLEKKKGSKKFRIKGNVL
ncbi:glycosyl transferase group 1 [Thermotoga petrophila RKU-10]|uniref:Glycosyl transferase group 1 n=1 Tax=Thermotoga petrophila (strain ATCC BAA-489 / DSM 13996 / JCM 10882 / RKU-10) TaxID=590168 RepID=D2C6C6_THEP2|nr:glycosyltransferase [Thermotoga petrophila]ADA66512.1 glycosyl transferase group 1 [Thermotoga petrophila RKU-10]